jgi:uncharacterized protein YlaN (UPF0358 family)
MLTAKAALELTMDAGKRREKIIIQLQSIEEKIKAACNEGKVNITLPTCPMAEVLAVINKSGYETDFYCNMFYIRWHKVGVTDDKNNS